MKKYGFIILSLVVIFVFVIGIIAMVIMGKEPKDKQSEKKNVVVDFTQLDESDVEGLYIYSIPIGSKVLLTETETKELLEKLNAVELIGKGSQEYAEYVGGTYPTFYMKLKDGTEADFAASAPFFIVNENGYEVEYKILDDIHQYYRLLVKKYFPDKYSPLQ